MNKRFRKAMASIQSEALLCPCFSLLTLATIPGQKKDFSHNPPNRLCGPKLDFQKCHNNDPK